MAEIEHNKLVDFLFSKKYHCGVYLHALDGVELTRIYQELETERLTNKYCDMRDLYNYVGRNMNQLLICQILRTLSDKNNKANFTEIGFRISHEILMRESEKLEALLIAVSGLIDALPHDKFTDSLRRDGAYLLQKYNITPLSKHQWNKPSRNWTHPILRLSQFAGLLRNNDHLFNKTIECRSREDIYDLFNVSASPEISSYFGVKTKANIGREKCDLIGINVVITLLYFYGHKVSDENLSDAAADLNESLPAENNRYINEWRRKGLTPTTCYESQALIQLAQNYCHAAKCRCEECVVFQHITSEKVNILYRIPNFLDQ